MTMTMTMSTKATMSMICRRRDAPILIRRRRTRLPFSKFFRLPRLRVVASSGIGMANIAPMRAFSRLIPDRDGDFRTITKITLDGARLDLGRTT